MKRRYGSKLVTGMLRAANASSACVQRTHSVPVNHARYAARNGCAPPGANRVYNNSVSNSGVAEERLPNARSAEEP